MAQNCLRLPICLLGCGLHHQSSRHSLEYMGGLSAGLSAILDCKISLLSDDGSDPASVTIPGIFNHPSLIDLLGAGSFDEGSATPWSVLLSHDTCSLAQSLRSAYEHILLEVNSFAVNVPVQDSSILL